MALRDTLFSILHAAGAASLLRSLRVRNRELSVLMFHRVSDRPDPLWPPMPVGSFRSLMEEVAGSCHVVPLEALGRQEGYPGKPLVAISFDDGYLDFLENAAPILTRLGLPAHHNVCPACIDRGTPPWTQVVAGYLQSRKTSSIALPSGEEIRISTPVVEKDFLAVCDALYGIPDDERQQWIEAIAKEVPTAFLPPLMTWDDIRSCSRMGFHIGSHGQSHKNLAQVNDPNLLDQEIRQSRVRIKEETGSTPSLFAFPNGLYHASSLKTVKESGYRIGLLCDDMVSNFRTLQDDDGFLVLPRINIGRSNWREESLRAHGLHQKIKSRLKGLPYVR